MINYLEPEELAQLIKEETESVLIIDVRDHDYEVSFWRKLKKIDTFFRLERL